MKDIEGMIYDLLIREGSEYTNRPADRGGPTRYGVTQSALAEYRGHPVTPDDVRNLGEPEARNIYRNNYLTRVQFHRIHDPYLLVLVFDCGVNHGTHRATQWLQQAAGVPDDGVLGDQTEVAVNSMDPVRLYSRVLARRVRFYGEIIAHDPERQAATLAGFHLQAENAGGWLNRAASFIEDRI